jgi:hypothetical protein
MLFLKMLLNVFIILIINQNSLFYQFLFPFVETQKDTKQMCDNHKVSRTKIISNNEYSCIIYSELTKVG